MNSGLWKSGCKVPIYETRSPSPCLRSTDGRWWRRAWNSGWFESCTNGVSSNHTFVKVLPEPAASGSPRNLLKSKESQARPRASWPESASEQDPQVIPVSIHTFQKRCPTPHPGFSEVPSNPQVLTVPLLAGSSLSPPSPP